MSALTPVRAVLGAAAVFLLVASAALYRRASEAPARSSKAAARAPSEEPGQPRVSEARRARDAMREQIVEALRRRDAGALPPSTPEQEEAGAEDAGAARYDPVFIVRHFREDVLPLVQRCYEDAREQRPELRGRLMLLFRILSDPSIGGVVEDAEFAEGSDLDDPEVETCVRESLMTLTFDDPPAGPGEVTVMYPVVFGAEDEETDIDSDTDSDSDSD